MAGLLSFRAEDLAFELLAEGLSVEIPVTGASMSPFIRAHDVLNMVPPEGPQLRGDVVAFPRPDGSMVVHRVAAVARGQLLTRGDGAPGPDSWIDQDRVVARVSHAHRRGRRVRLGLGPERSLIAFLSRRGLLAPALRPWRWFARLRARGSIPD